MPTPAADAQQQALRDGDFALADSLDEAVETEYQAEQARLYGPGGRLNAALWYAAQGILVFPCVVGGKRPATPRGFHDATLDPDKIRHWWKDGTEYNIGLPCGYQFDVFDIDSSAGKYAFDRLLASHKAPPHIALASTPRGWHHYVPPNPDATNRTGIIPSVDYRAAGGYVIAPPSYTQAGFYRWEQPLNLDPTP